MNNKGDRMKKGFTLIELLAILVILSLLTLILVPTIQNTIKGARKDSYDNQVSIIKQAAESYFIDSDYKVSEDDEKVIYLTDIIALKYLTTSKIINPKDDTEMTGCVLITKYSNQYHYKYLDNIEACQKYPNISE